MIDEPKHKIDIKSWERVGEEDGYLIYRGKFEEVPVEKIKCGSGTSCENTVENMQMTSLIVKVKLAGELLDPEEPTEPIEPEEPVDPVEPEEPENPSQEVWDAKYFTFEGTTLTGFSELGQDKFATDKAVVIPEKTTDGKIIDSIGDRAFNLDTFGENGIKYLTLPDTIKSIGTMAFRNNNIVHLDLPDSVEELGSGAFASNRDLETLKLSNSLKTIPNGAFTFTKIEELVIPEGVIEIGDSAFSENNLLSDLTIPSTVEKIGSRAFWNAAMVDLTIPGNVKEIDSDAFTGGKLSSLTLEEGIEIIGSRAFKRNKLTEVTIPKSVIKLDKSTFDRNPNININYASLIEILEKAKKANIEGKTKESVKALQEAIKTGEAINAKSEATLEEVNTAVKRIQEAIDGLEGNPKEPEDPEEPEEPEEPGEQEPTEPEEPGEQEPTEPEEPREEINEVEEMIDNLPAPDDVRLPDKDAVEAARAAYNALADDQKALVGEEYVEKLEALEEKIAELEDKAAAEAVIGQIVALPEVDELTLEDKAQVEAARLAYNALTEEQKALVTNLDELEALEEKIAELEGEPEEEPGEQEPTEPTEPTKPAEPAEPTGPAEPTTEEMPITATSNYNFLVIGIAMIIIGAIIIAIMHRKQENTM